MRPLGGLAHPLSIIGSPCAARATVDPRLEQRYRAGSEVQRPRHMLTHERTRMIGPCLERRSQFRIVAHPQRIADGDGDVAQPPFMADAPDRAAFGVPQEFLLAPAEQLGELAAREAAALVEI